MVCTALPDSRAFAAGAENRLGCRCAPAWASESGRPWGAADEVHRHHSVL